MFLFIIYIVDVSGFGNFELNYKRLKMKKLLLLSLSILVLGSCTHDENYINETAKISEDLTTMLPNRGLDNSEKGTYSGVIVADDTKFHGKIYLNIGNNDSRNQAIVESVRGDRLVFGFTENNGSIYSFAGTRGSFDVDITDISLVNTTNVIIDNNVGYVRVRKETRGTKNLIVTGTFDDDLSVAFGLPMAFTGTWDFMIDAGTAPLISETVYAEGGSPMVSDFSGDMEVGDSGCSFGFTPPRHEDDVAMGLWELIGVGQINTNANRTIISDYTFSKGLLDANTITDYTLGGGYMPQMDALIFGGMLTGCNTFAYHGYYLVQDSGGTFVAGGGITFDTSIVPPAPTTSPLTNEGAGQLQTAVLAESLGEL